MGVVLIKWAWLKILRALRARLYLQPHRSKNPRSAPELGTHFFLATAILCIHCIVYNAESSIKHPLAGDNNIIEISTITSVHTLKNINNLEV